jgi:hypothetical protein
MSDQLPLYLHDHLAGARFALELLQRLQDSYANQPLGDAAARLHSEIDEDRTVLQQLADEVGPGGGAIKQAASWLAEKASRLKLQMSGDADIGTFEVVETLSLGVLGKIKLWQALSAIKDSVSDGPLQRLNFEALITRARAQHDELELHRLKLAKAVLIERDANLAPTERSSLL